ncbi:transposase family protein [Nonomuraea sp. NPDC049695]|uniref:transposase family protein n=1 Tax=Nonomuraea sp. NPDC049695 TaxID=3154734 RepID=UPI003424E475
MQEVQAEREELVIAERVLNRPAEQDRAAAEAAAAVAPAPARVAERAVLLIPHRGETPDEAARNRPLTRGQKPSNKALAAVRAPVEHGLAHLKNWRVRGKIRTDPKWATALVRALLVLTNREVSR